MPTSWTTSSRSSSRLHARLRQRRRAATSDAPVTSPAIVPVIGAGDEITPALERRMLPTVRRAHAGCPDARDALYIAFRPKLHRFIRRVRVPNLGDHRVGLWDRGDVEQEAWLVFDELIRQWTPDRPFGRYVLATFPWRLHDTIYRGIGRRTVPPRMATVPLSPEDPLCDGTAASEEAQVLLDALADRLPAIQGVILRRHVRDGETLTEIARDLDVSRRTVTRQWRELRSQLATGLSGTPSKRHMA